jgi:hypothetical protein
MSIPPGFITMEQAISVVEPLIKAGLADTEIADEVGLHTKIVEQLRRYIAHRRYQ